MEITKCSGIGCEKRNKCQRFTNKSTGERQQYFIKPPLELETQFCTFFWGVRAESLFCQLKDIVNPCKHIKREGESCMLNDNCKYPNCPK